LLCTLVPATGAQVEPDNVALQIQRLRSPDAEIRLYAADALDKFTDRRAVAPLIAALRDSDPRVRARAANGLGDLKDARAVEPLIALLKDSDMNVQFAAASALGELLDRRAIPPLIAALSGRSSRAIQWAKFGPSAVGPLSAALKDKDPAMRQGAAEALMKFPEPRVFAALEAAMRDSDTRVRQFALLGLSASANPRREELVRTSLHDPDPALRRTALQAVSWINDPRMVDAVIAALSDPDPGVRTSAAVCLMQTGFQDPRAMEPLIEMLKDPRLYRTSAQALGSSHDPRAADALIALATSTGEWENRAVAMEDLGHSSDPRAAEVLAAALQDSNIGLRVTAAEQLGNLRDPRAIAPLAAAAKDPRIGGEAIAALGKIGPPAAATLKGLLDDPQTRRPALAAMVNAKDPSVVPRLIALLMTPYPGTPQPYGQVTEARTDPAPVPPTFYLDIISMLGRTGDERAVSPLIVYMKNGPIARDRIPQALLEIGSPSIGPLIPLLHDPDEKTRQLAAKALSDLALTQEKDSRPGEALLAALPTRDIAIMAGAYGFYVGVGTPGSENALIAALDRLGDQAMAEYLLNCGNVALEDAAFAWGEKRRFPVRQQVYGVVWGKMPKLEDRTSRDTGRSQPVDATLSSDAHSSENKS
jgi:HEAT repeat protein